QVRREGHDDVVHAEAESRQDQDGTPAVPVREGPEDGGEQELHQAEDCQEQAVDRAAAAESPPVNCLISSGSVGIVMPNPRVSRMIVTKMNASAACRPRRATGVELGAVKARRDAARGL